MTDANDVIVVLNPFSFLKPGRVYVGNQPGGLYPPEPPGDTWEYESFAYIKKLLATAGPEYHDFLETLGSDSSRQDFPALNAGILGVLAVKGFAGFG